MQGNIEFNFTNLYISISSTYLFFVDLGCTLVIVVILVVLWVKNCESKIADRNFHEFFAEICPYFGRFRRVFAEDSLFLGDSGFFARILNQLVVAGRLTVFGNLSGWASLGQGVRTKVA